MYLLKKMKNLAMRILPGSYLRQKEIASTLETLTEELASVTKAVSDLSETLGAIREMQTQLVWKAGDIGKSLGDLHGKMAKQRSLICEKNAELVWKAGDIGKSLGDLHGKMANQHALICEKNAELVWKNGDIGKSLGDLHAKHSKLLTLMKQYAFEFTSIHCFHDSIKDSPWLRRQSFSPSGWAATYLFLYSLYRILEIVKPRHILELGIGESTKLLTQYADADRSVEHIAVEDDAFWVEKFTAGHAPAPNTQILVCEQEIIDFMGTKVPVFKNLKDKLAGRKFDLIIVDAPSQSPDQVETKYRRIDVLSLLPDAVSDSFVIMVDDLQHPFVRNTFSLAGKCFEDKQILYRSFSINGVKEQGFLVSEDFAFFKNILDRGF